MVEDPTPAPKTPEILYTDPFVAVVNKPSGLLVHRGEGRDAWTLVDALKELWQQDAVYPVQRLDRGASGAILVARDKAAARKYQEDLQGGAIQKTYHVLVRGITPDYGVIDHPLISDSGQTRDARSSFQRVENVTVEPRSVSLVQVETQTGRKHQIRRHLKHLSHPVIGDARYGKGPLNRAFAETFDLTRLALHATQLTFRHLETEDPIAVFAPLPEDLAIPLGKMGFASIEFRGLLSEKNAVAKNKDSGAAAS